MNRTALVGILGLLVGPTAGCTVNEMESRGAYDTVPEEVGAPQEEPATAQEVEAPQEATVAFSEPPELVYVDPSVAVVENSNVPVYYADDAYWTDRDGVWYRADYWDAPWVSVAVGAVPAAIGYRDHRHYVHYHGRGADRRWREPREHSGEALQNRGEHGRREMPRVEQRPTPMQSDVPQPQPQPRPHRAAEAHPPIVERPAPPPMPRPATPPPRPPDHRVVTPPRPSEPIAPPPPPRLIPPTAPPPPPKNVPRPAPIPSPAPPPVAPAPPKNVPPRPPAHRPFK